MSVMSTISSNILWQRFHLNETVFLSRQWGTPYVEYTAKLDGKEYPVKVSPPSPGSYTIALTRINSRTRGFVENLGKMTIKGQDVLSEDGKSFSRIVNSKDAEGHDTSIIQFFEKQ